MKLLTLHSDIVEAKSPRSPEQCRRDFEERAKTDPLVKVANNEKKIVLDILNRKLKLIPNLTSQGNFSRIDSKNGQWWPKPDVDINLNTAFSDEPLPDEDEFNNDMRFVDPLLGIVEIVGDNLIIDRELGPSDLKDTKSYRSAQSDFITSNPGGFSGHNLKLFIKYGSDGWHMSNIYGWGGVWTAQKALPS